MKNEYEKRNWCVYMHTNLFNGKMYVGITGKGAKHRWGKGYRHCTKMNHAIKKYGWDGFDHRVLVDNLTKEEAEEIEQNLIEDLMLQDDKYGYNITPGGSAPIMTEETKRKISEANKGHGGRGGGSPKRPVLCVETGTIFESCSDAARWCGSNSSHISNACRGTFEKTKGYHWKFA